MIHINNLYKSYKTVPALSGLSVDFLKGKVSGLVGANGSGKTTLLKVLSCLIGFDSGEVLIDGEKLNYTHSTRIASLIEEPAFYPGLTGFENLCYFLKKGEKEALFLNYYIQLFKMESYIHKKFKTYSLGMKQRLGIIYVLLQDKEILLFDEPVNGLDPSGIRTFKKVLKEQADNKNKTIIIVSHNMIDLQEICDEIILIKSGRLINKIDITNKRNNKLFKISFYNREDIDLAKDILTNENVYIENDFLFIEMIDERNISNVIRRLQHLSIGEVQLVQNNLADLYFQYLGD